ncbi:hypothetical protein DFH28DRAFT_1119520 [Melampsora americana]|nr:hypothetical protein DFH28DRAFT_1119520 [Melampsora americana]
MHLSTLISSLVLASAVSASSHPGSSDNVAHLAVRSPSEQEAGVKQKSVKIMCAVGSCGGMGIPINPALGFAQPMIFNNAPALANFATFGAGLGATVGLWAGASFQIIQQQFTMMIVSMSTLMAPFLSGCGAFCTAAMGPMFLQTVTQIVMQMQALCQIIWTQFPGQIALFGNQFQIMAMFFQTVIGMGLTMGINVQALFASPFNMGLFQNLGFGFPQGIPCFGAVGLPGAGRIFRSRQLNFGGFGAGQFFGGGRVGLIGQLLNPLVTLLSPVTTGLGSLLHNVGLGVGSLLSGGAF